MFNEAFMKLSLGSLLRFTANVFEKLYFGSEQKRNLEIIQPARVTALRTHCSVSLSFLSNT